MFSGYQLAGVPAGSYSLTGALEGFAFGSHNIAVSPQNTQLPDIKLEKLKVCGRIMLKEDERPAGVFPMTVLFDDVVRNCACCEYKAHPQNGKQQSISSSTDGSFCTNLAPATYKVRPQSTTSHMVFSAQEIRVVRQPITELVFTQVH